MYEKPRLERFGTFRELTQVGWVGASDGCTIIGPNTAADGNTYLSDCYARS